MKLRYKLILMNLTNERLNNRSMNLQLRPSPTICHDSGVEERRNRITVHSLPPTGR